ncbi:hypothetical protein [Nocardia nova]|jgi:hypothetical protein|uniref:hypothetical protein n=1 Tax=Nocardia nova TaxID=37330 RepID=UPI0007A4554F|nr:hypothetical protein [Nocardia nova]
MMPLPAEVVALLRGYPSIGVREQIYPLLSVDRRGFPHTALLSRSELEPTADGQALTAVVASAGTQANLRRSGRAALLAIHDTTCHHMKLELMASLQQDGLLGGLFAVVEHKRDDIGIPMQPLTFHATAALAEHEDWRRSSAVLMQLEQMHEGRVRP